MFSTKSIVAAAAALSLMSSVTADYNPASQGNLAMYYGQGPSQKGLKYYCDQSAVDIIPIGFINIFPNLGNGYVAENFGNQCWDGNYTGPGYNGNVNPKNDFLYKQCPQLQEDIYYCQTKTKKKILLSLGGDGGNYQLNGAADGQFLADFLWGAYGPYDDAWVKKGGVRPLDRGYSNSDPSKTIDIDGFDFDIERASPDKQVGYVACIRRLREHFATYKKINSCSKTYLISGAPQCPLPEGNMGITIAGAQFDLLFIQFYNNGANGCTARNWVTNKAISGFNYNQWVSTVNAGASKGAKLYLGLLGSQRAGTAADYLTAIEAQSLIDAWHGAAQFGGVMLWEATYADENLPSSFPGKTYYQAIKQVLNKYAPVTTAPATVCSSTISSTRTSSSYSNTSSLAKVSSTLSTSKSSSTSKSVSSTQSSSSSKTTIASSSVKPSSSSSSVKPASSSSSLKPTSSSSSTQLPSSSFVKPSSSSVQASSSSSSSKPVTTSLSSVSTTKTAAGEFTTTSPSSAAPSAPGCFYKGCFTEAEGIRALSETTKADFEGMTIEVCADFCSGYTLYGLEYTGECYCGNSLNAGSVAALESECNIPCTGDASQTCGGSNHISVYECGSAPTFKPVSSSATSSIVSISISESSTVSATFTMEPTSSSSEAPVSSSSSEYVTPTISNTFSHSATETSISETYVMPTVSNTFSYSATESSTSSPFVTPTPSSSGASESSSSESVTQIPIFSSETSSEATSSTQSGPVTSSSYVSSSSVGSNYGSQSTSVGTSTSVWTGVITSMPTYVPTSSKTLEGVVTYTSNSTLSSVTKYTTSTVCTTRVETITACAPKITNCPVGSVTTKTIPLYTTVCPVTETESTKTAIGKLSTIPVETPAFTGVAIPSKTYPSGSEHSSAGGEHPKPSGGVHYEYDSSTTIRSSTTTTQYKTIEIVKSTATLIPLPPTTLVPYPTGPAKEGYPSGTAAPTTAAQKTSSAEGVTSTKNPFPIYVTSAASSSSSAVGVMVAVVAGVVALML